MDYFKLEIITPDRAYPPRDALLLNVPAEEGYLTVLAHHQPMICCVKSGKVKITDSDGKEEGWRVEPGMLKVHGNAVTLLVERITSDKEQTLQ